MSEPDSGSDLASVRTKAVREGGGWRVNGTKLWTTNATQCHFMILFCRTGPLDREQPACRHEPVHRRSEPAGITIRPVRNLSANTISTRWCSRTCAARGRALGREGEGWGQVTGELAYERSGPERFCRRSGSSSSWCGRCSRRRRAGRDRARAAGGAAHHAAAHVALGRGPAPGRRRSGAGSRDGQGSRCAGRAGDPRDRPRPRRRGAADAAEPDLREVLAYTTLHAPSFSLRGGTREILRGIIARGLGLR